MQQRFSSFKKIQLGFTGLQVLLIVLAVILITTLVSFYVIKTYIFPSPFTPVMLNSQETHTLDNKLAMLGWQSDVERSTKESPTLSSSQRQSNAKGSGSTIQTSALSDPSSDLTPQPYRELAADRLVSFSEKEVNAMIARNPDFAQRVAIDFSQDLASAAILVPIPQDFPLMPGQTLRVSTGLNISLDVNQRPVVSLKGISLMGVPLPNAWLGNIKNINLVNEFGDGGFWTTFADGVETISVSEGALNIKLKE